MKKILLSLASAAALCSFSQSANAGDPVSGTDPAGTPVPDMKVGIVDYTGQTRTIVQAWRDPRGGWTPALQVVVHFPGFASEDALMVQFKKGKKKIGKPFACSADSIATTYQDNQTTPVYKADLAYFNCRLPKEYSQKSAGTYALDLSIRQPLLGKNQAIGSLVLKAINIKQGSQNKPQTIQTELQDSMVGTAFVYEAPLKSGSRNNLKSIANSHHRGLLQGKYTDSTNLNIEFWSKDTKSTDRRSYTAACLYNGKKVASKSGIGNNHGVNMTYWSYLGKKGKEVITVNSHVFQMHQLRVRHKVNQSNPPNNSNWHYLDQNPGHYSCKFLADGALMGSVDFDVADGAIVKTPCQSEINTPDNVYVVPFIDKGVSSAKPDKSLTKRVFFGPRSWSKKCQAKK